MTEEEGREDDRKGRREHGWESRCSQQHTLWNPASAAPYLKWKVFVRGNDSTLQGRGVCEVEESCREAHSFTPALHGDATKCFYESVVRQGDRRTNIDTHEQTDTNNQAQINTDRHRERDTEKYRYTHTQGDRKTDRHRERDTEKYKYTHTHGDRKTDRHRERDTEKYRYSHTHGDRKADRERDKHRNTDLSRPRQADTNSHRRPQETIPIRHQVTSSCQDHTSHNIEYPCLPSTHPLPLGPQDTHTALRLAQTNDAAALSRMIDQGLNINTKDRYGWSLLMVAACAGAMDAVRMLLTYGARTGFRDARGNTALYLATIKGHREVTEILVKANKHRTYNREHEEETDTDSSSSEMVDEEYFCDTCEVLVRKKESLSHKASIIHQFKVKAGQTRTLYGIPPSNRGYQLLVGQGWNTEDGLGSEKQGLKFPVKTVLKRDRKGLGAGGEKTPRVTHFDPGDAAAIKRTRDHTERRLERPNTISRREMKRKKMHEQKEDIRLRRMLNEPDY